MLADSQRIILDAIKLRSFQTNYCLLHPSEIQPTDELLKYLFIKDGINVLLSGFNLIIYIENKDNFEIVAHWCLAHKSLPREDNMRAFREVLKFARKQSKPVIITNLNEEYMKATKPYSSTYRMF